MPRTGFRAGLRRSWSEWEPPAELGLASGARRVQPSRCRLLAGPIDVCGGGPYFRSEMDRSLIEDLVASSKPFRIETAAGRVFDIPHRDFVSFSRNRTALIISYAEDGEDHFAIVPLLTVTSAMARAGD